MGRARCLLLESFVCSFFRILCVISSSVTASSHWSERERKIGRERAKRGRERERKRKREGERRVEEKEREERARGGGVPPPPPTPLFVSSDFHICFYSTPSLHFLYGLICALIAPSTYSTSRASDLKNCATAASRLGSLKKCMLRVKVGT